MLRCFGPGTLGFRRLSEVVRAAPRCLSCPRHGFHDKWRAPFRVNLSSDAGTQEVPRHRRLRRARRPGGTWHRASKRTWSNGPISGPASIAPLPYPPVPTSRAPGWIAPPAMKLGAGAGAPPAGEVPPASRAAHWDRGRDSDKSEMSLNAAPLGGRHGRKFAAVPSVSSGYGQTPTVSSSRRNGRGHHAHHSRPLLAAPFPRRQ
jgi:hypothetical protein